MGVPKLSTFAQTTGVEIMTELTGLLPPPPPENIHGVSGVIDARIVPISRVLRDHPTREGWEGYCPAGVYGQTMNEGFGVMGIDNPDASDGLWAAVGA